MNTENNASAEPTDDDNVDYSATKHIGAENSAGAAGFFAWLDGVLERI